MPLCTTCLSTVTHVGAGRTPASLGDHTGLGGELEPVEDWPVPDPADGEHGEHGPRAVSAPHKISQRVQGARGQEGRGVSWGASGTVGVWPVF